VGTHLHLHLLDKAPRAVLDVLGILGRAKRLIPLENLLEGLGLGLGGGLGAISDVGTHLHLHLLGKAPRAALSDWIWPGILGRAERLGLLEGVLEGLELGPGRGFRSDLGCRWRCVPTSDIHEKILPEGISDR
jgi:hypothetical protein